MSATANPATSATADVDAYISALFTALGSRDPIAVLRETPDALREGIAQLSPGQLRTPEAPGKWSAGQMIQHLADSELVGAFRFRMILAHDKPAIPGYDQDAWAQRLRYEEADVETALGDFTTIRRLNLRLLERTSSAERLRAGIHTERGEESLGKLLRMYAGHDLVHRKQLERIRHAVCGA